MMRAAISFGVRAVIPFAIFLAASSLVEAQRQPQDLPGVFVGFGIDGKCSKEVRSADLALVGLNELQVPRGSKPGTSIIQVCCEGYTVDIHNSSRCYPICSRGCEDGLCVAPETCQCHIDRVRNLANKCVSTCPFNCPNGRCNGNQCICDSGYDLDPTRKFCMARCDFGCGANAYCHAPNQCMCSDGYILAKGMICQPECKPACINSVCTAPNTCSCSPGFDMVNNTCVRSCPNGCRNGTCNHLGVCTCSPGWTLNKKGDGCEPVCQGGCINGTCTAPNVCECLPGFLKIGPNCQPLCSRGCRGGTCVAPEQCVCPKGQILNGDTCVGSSVLLSVPSLAPQGGSCSQPCFNGLCVGLNRCTCNPGYVNDPITWNMCLPYCPNGCLNGLCTAPNTCICNRGFRKLNGVCVK